MSAIEVGRVVYRDNLASKTVSEKLEVASFVALQPVIQLEWHLNAKILDLTLELCAAGKLKSAAMASALHEYLTNAVVPAIVEETYTHIVPFGVFLLGGYEFLARHRAGVAPFANGMSFGMHVWRSWQPWPLAVLYHIGNNSFVVYKMRKEAAGASR